MLELRKVSTRYGPVQVLWDISLEVHPGELVCLLGGNASGKSTTMKTIMGLVHPFQGEVLFEGKPIHHLTPAEIVKTGIAPVLESRRIFPELTIYENLLMGAYTRSDQRGNPKGHRKDLRPVSRSLSSGATRWAERCPAASSRCWPWPAPSWPAPR